VTVILLAVVRDAESLARIDARLSRRPTVDAWRKEWGVRVERGNVALNIWPSPLCNASDPVTRVSLRACGADFPARRVHVSALQLHGN